MFWEFGFVVYSSRVPQSRGKKMKNLDHLKLPRAGETSSRFTKEQALAAQKFHQTLPGYLVTRLVELPALAKELGVKDIFVKDEASRFGLNSFKGLGGSYCISRLLSEKYGWSGKVESFAQLKDQIATLEEKPKIISATDGNHGRGLAWMCHLLGLKCEILIPAGSSEERLENIRKLGAECCRTDGNYDETVHEAERLAQENGWLLVQDTALPGFEKVAQFIMQGYLTMALEAVEQLKAKRPTHIFLQAGVGSMAGAMCGFFASLYGPNVPVISIVEPKTADCIYRTAGKDDGKLHNAPGSLETIMAGLSCGEPCSIGWQEIRSAASHYFRIEESVAATGVRVLSSPLENDPRILSGESGAAGFGAAFEMLFHKAQYREEINSLGLNSESVLLFFNTEGVTDRENFLKIVWEGAFAEKA